VDPLPLIIVLLVLFGGLGVWLGPPRAKRTDPTADRPAGDPGSGPLEALRRMGGIWWLWAALLLLSNLALPVLVPLVVFGVLPGPAYWLLGYVVLEMILLLAWPLAARRAREVGIQ